MLDLGINEWKISTAFKNAYAVDFYFAESPHVGFKLEEEFRIIQGGDEIRVNPQSASEREVNEAFAPLMGIPVKAAFARESGLLEINFHSGAALECGPGDMYEPWSYYGPNGQRIFSLPGGRITVVDPVAES